MFDYSVKINKKVEFRLTLTRWILLLLTLVGISLMVFRLINGLGASTNLSNEWPWGFWIYCDLILSALGACGFAIGILVHVFHVQKYKPLARRALLVSFLCYTLVFLILFIEIGRWDNFYWIFASFAFTSPLYEVFACLTIYFILQILELVEIWGDRYKHWVQHIAKFFLPAIILVACVIPFGQEAALGALYLGMPTKLNALWSSQFLPWGCLISAFFGGICFITTEYYGMNRHYRQKSDPTMMKSILRLAAVVMWAYLILKIIDISVRGLWGYAFSGTMEANMFLIEMFIGIVVPAVLAFTPFMAKPKFQIFVALCGVAGILLNRFNFIFVGMAKYAGVSYFPSWIEIWTVIGLTALVVLVYLFAVENLPIFRDKNKKKAEVVSMRESGYISPVKKADGSVSEKA
ncbi:MAG: NrfD/PsrC family molybdoenzyme membrane anchor subunit [Clostridiales bacterium]